AAAAIDDAGHGAFAGNVERIGQRAAGEIFETIERETVDVAGAKLRKVPGVHLVRPDERVFARGAENRFEIGKAAQAGGGFRVQVDGQSGSVAAVVEHVAVDVAAAVDLTGEAAAGGFFADGGGDEGEQIVAGAGGDVFGIGEVGLSREGAEREGVLTGDAPN